MFDFKRLSKLLVCALCLVSLLIANPVSALSTSSSLISTTTAVINSNQEEELDSTAPVSTGHLVSVVHYSPYYSSNVIGCLENGTVVTVLKTTRDFYKIDCYDMYGYIAKSQVAVNEAGEYYVNCDVNSSESKYLGSRSAQATMELKSNLFEIAKSYIGVRYVEGGTSPKYGFDCSGYTQYVFRKAGIELHRTAIYQMQDGVIVAEEDLQPGDLIFYSGTGDDGGFASHVAIYIGNGKIIHASSTKGIVIADFHLRGLYEYYQCARRVILTDMAVTVSIPTVNSITSSVGSGWRS